MNIIRKEKSNDEKSDIHEQAVAIQLEIEKQRKELQRMKAEQEKLLEQTRVTIQLEKDNWAEEKQQLMEQAKQVGYGQGLELGKQEGLEQYEQLITHANSIVDLTMKDYHAKLDESDETILEIAIHTAEKILKHHLSEQAPSFLGIVTAAIEDIKDQSDIYIYLHPDNYEFIMQQKEELLQSLDGDTKISIYIDHKLNKHDCLIKHPFGQVEAGIDTQLEQLRKILLEVVMEDKE